jgi:outer membrane lipoprotein-sorting protein
MRVKEYLDGIKTLKGGFLQISSNGNALTGKVYLSKPGRFRFEYDPPESVLMIADGFFFIYIDKELEHVTHVFLKNTPINFLVKEKVEFDGDITVTKFERSPGVLQITVKKTQEPETGSITLVFSDNPILLKKWKVIDAQNILTTVNLTGIQTGVDLDQNLFIYTTIKHDQ